MAHLIRVGAAVADLLSDILTTATRCAERGGVWATEGKRWLGDVVTLVGGNADQLKAVSEELLRVRTARDVALARAKVAVGSAFDRLKNELGRPAHDPYLTIAFPDGADSAEGPMHDRPALIEAIAEILESVGHPRVPGELCAGLAIDLRKEAGLLRDALLRDQAVAARVETRKRVRRALAQVGRTQLVAMKASLTALQFRESEIHSVIPDHPPKVAKTDAVAPEPAAEEDAPAAEEAPVEAPAPSEPDPA
jgi:hypothetical protein